MTYRKLLGLSGIDVFTDIDDKVNAFNTMFNDILNQHAPIKTIKVKGKPNPCVYKTFVL